MLEVIKIIIGDTVEVPVPCQRESGNQSFPLCFPCPNKRIDGLPNITRRHNRHILHRSNIKFIILSVEYQSIAKSSVNYVLLRSSWL
jgi:hypothetical protein